MAVSLFVRGLALQAQRSRVGCIQSRSLASAVAEVAIPEAETASVSPAAQPNYKIMSGLILSRPPVITPEQTPFEKAYYFYQSELKKRLMWTFPSWFYFPEGTLAGRRFQGVQKVIDQTEREEFEKPDVLYNRDRRSKQDVVLPERDVERETEESARLYAKITPVSRTTEADAKNDVHSLERKLDRTLYLIVKKDRKSHAWKFPTTEVVGTETLTDTAKRLLSTAGGLNMNTWIIANTPVAYFHYPYKPTDNEKFQEAKVFFLRSRIFAGTFAPQPSSDIVDYAWVTKQELKDYFHKDYYNTLSNALSSH
ncbi:39S mitochondrial ribosomal protein L46-domain-containing protein [Lipomyces arxii]|uniref:mitochondrial 54S ribosomal protein mL46 n=1 Tax=Lipomyces arxii TaxID=56418 RepID=UPI0034CE82A9